MTKACLGAGAGRKGHSFYRAWEPEAKAAQGPMEGLQSHLFPQGPILSSHNITALPTLLSSWWLGY